MEDFLHSEGLLNRLFSQRVITGRRFSRLHPKATSAVFCKDSFGDGYHFVIRGGLDWAEIVRTTSYGMRAQSAVMKSSVVTARMATV